MDKEKLMHALWRIYNRPTVPLPWAYGGNLPWNDPDFSIRMLREHLDESHGAASRVSAERELQLDWLWSKLEMQEGMRILDVTCGPGLYAVALAERGCLVTGVDYSPASIAYARELASEVGVADRCLFIQKDVREMDDYGANFDAALLLYGQLAVFPRAEAQMLLSRIVQALRPGGRLCIELLNQERVDKRNSSWWYTDDKGLWGEAPFLHLGERSWLEEEKISIERYHILHLQTGQLDEINLCDQTYAVTDMVQMIQEAGFNQVDVYPAWDGLPLYDADEWIVYIASTKRDRC